MFFIVIACEGEGHSLDSFTFDLIHFQIAEKERKEREEYERKLEEDRLRALEIEQEIEEERLEEEKHLKSVLKKQMIELRGRDREVSW